MVIHSTWAVTASVSLCAANASVVAIGAPFPRSTDPRQRIAHQLVHHPLAAEARLHQHHPRRLRAHLADLGRAARSPGPSAAPRARGRRPPGPRRRRACPRWPRTSDRCPRSPTPRPPPGRPAPRPRARSSPRCDARASSFSTEATPPRVASRMQRSDGPDLLEQRVHDRPQRAGVGLDLGVELELAAREHDRRAVLADRAGEQDAVARPERVGGHPRARVAQADAAWCTRTSRPRRRAPRPWCRRPRSRRRRPRRPRRSPRPRPSARPPSRPSSRISDRLSASGRAPDTARSLTVPFTARSPIEPPGKRIGLTTKESVVIASSTPSTCTAPASPIASSAPDAEGRARTGPRSSSAWPCRRRRGPW